MRVLIGFLIIVLSINTAYSQNSEEELWTGIDITKKVAKRTYFQWSNQIRLDNGFTSPKKVFSEFGLRYKLNKYMSTAASYRYSYRFQKKSRNRFTFLLNLKYKIKDLKLTPSYRFRYQREEQVNRTTPVSYHRHKFKLLFNFSKLVDPYFAYERFYRINGTDGLVSEINGFEAIRSTIGLKWNLPAKWELVTYYRINESDVFWSQERTRVVGFFMSKSIGRNKKKKKKKDSDD